MGTLTAVRLGGLRQVFMQELLDRLNNIFEVLEKENVAPPIADEEFQRLSDRLPFKLPTTVEMLYRWHNGVEELIPFHNFLSLSDAITQYEELIAFEKEYRDESSFNRNHLPIIRSQNFYILVDCTPISKNSIYYLYLEEENAQKKYDSLNQAFQIIVDAYLSRAYYVEDGVFMDNPVLFRKIETKYFSQEQRNEREANWNRLCIELHELRLSHASQKKSSEDPEWEELAGALGLAAPADFHKEMLIRRLSGTYDERAIDYLVDFLNEANPEIVAKAAFGLGELRARERLPELLNLTNHQAEVVRNLATHAIAAIVSPEDKLLLRPLLKLLSDEAVLVRIAAVEALGQLRNSVAVRPLINMLQDRSSGIRYHVIQSLGKIGDTRAVEALQRQKGRVLPDEARLIDHAISLIEQVNTF